MKRIVHSTNDKAKLKDITKSKKILYRTSNGEVGNPQTQQYWDRALPPSSEYFLEKTLVTFYTDFDLLELDQSNHGRMGMTIYFYTQNAGKEDFVFSDQTSLYPHCCIFLMIHGIIMIAEVQSTTFMTFHHL